MKLYTIIYTKFGMNHYGEKEEMEFFTMLVEAKSQTDALRKGCIWRPRARFNSYVELGDTRKSHPNTRDLISKAEIQNVKKTVECKLHVYEIKNLIGEKLEGDAHSHWVGLCRQDRDDLVKSVQNEDMTIDECAKLIEKWTLEMEEKIVN